MACVLDTDYDALRVDRVDDSGALAKHDGSRIAGGDALHSRAHDRRIGAQQRDCLALHVRSHQGTIRVIVLEERNQACRHRDQLLGTHVQVLDLFSPLELEVTRDAAVREFPIDESVLIDRDVGLGDNVLIFFPCRQIRAEGLHLGVRHIVRQGRVGFFGSGAPHNVARPESSSSRVDDSDLVDDLPILDLAVRALDEAILVDAGEAGKRTDQADVGPFRRFDRTDSTVVRGMHVPHVEASPLAGQPARPERREPPLVSDLRKRVDLIHELR